MLSFKKLTPALVIILITQFLAFAAPVKSQVLQPETSLNQFEVRFHPSQPFYVGDFISIEVYSQAGANLQDQELSVSLDGPQPKQLGAIKFNPAAGNRYLATLQWIWDTHGLVPGVYSLTFSVTPAGEKWQQSVTLEAPPPNYDFRWVNTDNNCCHVHLISGTAAERDLAKLLPEIDLQVQQVEQEFDHTLSQKIDINLIPIVLGQSGFTANEIYVSYTDLNYTDTDFLTVLHHELVHYVDTDIGNSFRPLILVEGLAVYMTGGHYRHEPLSWRAAALPEIGRYVPLTNLANNFYSWQHEAGYLEAGALLEYMVRAYGWDAYNKFYRDIHPVQNGSDSQAIDQALQIHFGITLRQLDDRFLSYLQSIPVIPQLREDVLLTVNLFDTIRLFQQEHSPSAFFQQAWLPDARQMRAKGIVADYLPRGSDPLDFNIEKILATAGNYWLKGDYNSALAQLALAKKQLHP